MNVTPAESSLSLIVIEGWTIALKKKSCCRNVIVSTE